MYARAAEDRTERSPIIVGAYALVYRIVPRFTGDLDILVHATPDNASNVLSAMAAKPA
jgi:hypothetical protein